MSTSYSDVMKLFNNEKEIKKVERKKKEVKFPRKWIPNDDYELFRKGIELKVPPNQLRNKNALSEKCLFYFKHKRNVVKYIEDKQRPLWRGLLKVKGYPEGSYYVPTQDEEKIIYRFRSAKNRPLNNLMEDQTPYWTDSYYHKKDRERRNKKKHTTKKKEEKKRKMLMKGIPSLDTQQNQVKRLIPNTKTIATQAKPTHIPPPPPPLPSSSSFTVKNKKKKKSKSHFTSEDKSVGNCLGLTIDNIMFFELDQQVTEKLRRNNFISNPSKKPNSSKIVKKSLATSSSCNQIIKISKEAVSLLFSQDNKIPNPSKSQTISSSKKRKNTDFNSRFKKSKKVNTNQTISKSNYYYYGKEGFTSKSRFPPSTEIPQPIKDFLSDQLNKMGSFNCKKDVGIAMRKNHSVYANKSTYLENIISNATGELLLDFYNFTK